MKERIEKSALIAMSGGVDSSVAAYLAESSLSHAGLYGAVQKRGHGQICKNL